MAYDTQNIFAKILRGEIPCDTLYQDQWAWAFADLSPQAPTHILVIPTGPYVSMDDFTEQASAEEISGFFRAVGQVARDAGAVDNGYRMMANHGPDSRQEIPHFHVHIVAGRNLGPLLTR